MKFEEEKMENKAKNVWRFNLNTKEMEISQEECFDFCRQKGIIGTWLGI